MFVATKKVIHHPKSSKSIIGIVVFGFLLFGAAVITHSLHLSRAVKNAPARVKPSPKEPLHVQTISPKRIWRGLAVDDNGDGDGRW